MGLPATTTLQSTAQLARRRCSGRVSMLLDPTALHDSVHALSAMDHVWLGHVVNGLADTAVATLSDAAAGVSATANDAAAAVAEQGWFDQFVEVFKNTIKSINTFYNSIGIQNAFGLSIVTFTVAVKLVLLPLNYFQLQSTEKMAQITPVQKKIGEMYPNDKAMQQAIVGRLYEQVQHK
jgi:membrane protein insertase Oxa1/YidC/SpoIIIJ